MSLGARVNFVKKFLAAHCMLVDDEWLTGCVEYLTEDESNSYSDADIQRLAKEQWLLNDLKDICPGSLPAGIKNLSKTVLNGKFVLQINSAIDIGTPAYQQYLKIQKVNVENIEATVRFEDKVPSHRMIKLILTDGVQEITAIEYKPMRNLNCDITPGCKVLIKGPVDCRRGMLLLTEACIELLGGEVQEIAESNSLAGLLSSKLRLPITRQGNHKTANNQNINTTLPMPHTQMPLAYPTPNDPPDPRPVARVTSIQVADNFMDDDIDVDELAALEEQLTNNPSKRQSNEELTKPEKRLKIDTCVNREEEYLRVNRIQEYPDDCDLFLFEEENRLDDLEARFHANENETIDKRKGPIYVSSEPYVYLKQICNLSETEKGGRVFKVKAQIIKLLSKLSVSKDGWSLRCTIIDGTGTLDVDFTSDVLSKLVGYTPQEMILLKKEMVGNPELKQKAVMALQKAKDSLQVLNCIIELTILEVPKITSLIPFDNTQVNLLKKRLNNSGLYIEVFFIPLRWQTSLMVSGYVTLATSEVSLARCRPDNKFTHNIPWNRRPPSPSFVFDRLYLIKFTKSKGNGGYRKSRCFKCDV